MGYAEPFQRFLPEVRYLLPVTDAELAHIDEPPEVMMGRRSEMTGGLLPLPEGAAFTIRHRVPREWYGE